MDIDSNIKAKVANIKQIPQIATSFPNHNDKHIDYVIAYTQNDDDKDQAEREANRAAFFKEVREQDIEVKFIEFKTGKENHVYALLHCSIDRLMAEAEQVNLDMKLDKVGFQKNAE